MKHKHRPHEHNHHQEPQVSSNGASRSPSVMELRQGGGFVPGVDEVAKQAYIMYVNQGSLPGHDVEHWLEAEARLFAEANVSRTFEFQDQQ